MKMADLALERLKGSDEQRRAELERTKQEALQICKSRRCFFSVLPVEIYSEIFLFVAEDSNTKTVVLSAVCRRWRDIITDMPMLWRHLVLTPASTGKKVETWLLRARGTFQTLQLRKGFTIQDRPNIFRKFNAWNRLETLRLQVPANIGSVSDTLPAGAFEQLNLRELELSFIDSHPPSFWDPLDFMGSSSLGVLHISSATTIPWTHLSSFINLRTLVLIDCPFSFQEVYQFLTQRPHMEKLILMYVSGIAPTLEGPLQDVQPLDLPHLLHFEIGTTNGDMSHFFSHLVFPNINTLSISCALRNTRYLDALEKCPAMTQLTELAIRRCLISQRPMSNTLRKAINLQRLVYSECTGDPTDSIIGALSHIQGKLDSLADPNNTTITIPCPNLQHLDLSGCQDLQAGPVVRLVKAHLPSSQSNDNRESSDSSQENLNTLRISRIRTLILNDCVAVDAQVLPWLRSKVDIVHCTMTIKGKARKRPVL